MSSRLAPPRAVLLASTGLLLAGLLFGACIHRGYPLGPSGSVDIRPQISGPLFAADLLDQDGNPTGARQVPHETAVDLYITESEQAAYGAFVTVRVDPADALTLSSNPGEKGDLRSCQRVDGAFRCMASKEGYARFIVSSEGRWSGDANIIVTWANQKKEQVVHVLPAGLPIDATNFQLVVGGSQSDHVLATYVTVSCTIGPVPDDLGSKWRPGEIRAREAYVRATPPPASPSAVENAPAYIESLSGEAMFSLAEDCAERTSSIRVLFGADGRSPSFFLCFSDNGGLINYSVSSGQKVIDPPPTVNVDPEPRLLRVLTLANEIQLGFVVGVFEITAYNADQARIAMPVDISVGDPKVIGISQGSITLAGEESDATVIQVIALAEGTTELHVKPRLLSMPDCTSPPVTVVPAPTFPPP